MRRSISVLVPVLLVVVALLATTVPAAARKPIALGIASDNSRDMAEVVGLTSRTGVKPRLWTLWSTWGDRGGAASCTKQLGTCSFPTAAAKQLKQRGITPIIWWQPSGPGSTGEYGSFKRIAKGKHDAYIRSWAKAAKRFGKPVVVRLAHEMNGGWFEWGITRNSNSPKAFTKAWRHVVQQFRKVGARNVKFLWSPYPYSSISFSKFYPGNEWVDYVGVTVLNWGNERWRSLDKLLSGAMTKLRNTTRTRSQPLGKPVILPEFGSHYVPNNKAAWLRKSYEQAYKKWPAIAAIVYFDVDMSYVGQPDWRLEQPGDGSALAAYREIASQKRFKGKLR